MANSTSSGRPSRAHVFAWWQDSTRHNGRRALLDPDGRRPRRDGRFLPVPIRADEHFAIGADAGQQFEVELGDHQARPVETAERQQTGRASWWERVCQYVSISVVAVSLKKKNIL